MNFVSLTQGIFALNILDIKIDEFTEVRAREEMHLNRRMNSVGRTSHSIVPGRRNIGLYSNK